MTYIVSGGALNPTHSLTCYSTLYSVDANTPVYTARFVRHTSLAESDGIYHQIGDRVSYGLVVFVRF